MFENTIQSMQDMRVAFSDKDRYYQWQAALGIAYAYWSGRIDGSYAMALRKLDHAQTMALVNEVATLRPTQYDVVQWLREHRARYCDDGMN